MRFPLPEIHHDHASFDALAQLHARTKEYVFDDIEIDMGLTHWFDAEMCAAFGAILHNLRTRLNEVNLIHIPPRVEEILSKNGFLSHYGREKIPDWWRTTIAYQRFDVKDDHYFAEYIEKEFIHRSEIPIMSPGLLKKFRESIFEMFSNAVLHSQTRLGIFSCGQYFPNQNRLDFTVADLGVGIRKNIRDYIGYALSPEKAIIWATEEFNTTKRGNVPGGSGLKILRDFIGLNGGSIQIVSDAGYWQFRDGKVVTEPLSFPFPGTVVSVEINTADKHVYSLTSELNVDDIF